MGRKEPEGAGDAALLSAEPEQRFSSLSNNTKQRSVFSDCCECKRMHYLQETSKAASHTSAPVAPCAGGPRLRGQAGLQRWAGRGSCGVANPKGNCIGNWEQNPPWWTQKAVEQPAAPQTRAHMSHSGAIHPSGAPCWCQTRPCGPSGVTQHPRTSLGSHPGDTGEAKSSPLCQESHALVPRALQAGVGAPKLLLAGARSSSLGGDARWAHSPARSSPQPGSVLQHSALWPSAREALKSISLLKRRKLFENT